MFWSYIPHFINSPFYVYAYAFGDCMVNSLYGVYEREPAGFQEKYFALLSAGGTKHHSELLAPFGLDARDPAFWQTGLGVIEGLIDELGRRGPRGRLTADGRARRTGAPPAPRSVGGRQEAVLDRNVAHRARGLDRG